MLAEPIYVNCIYGYVLFWCFMQSEPKSCPRNQNGKLPKLQIDILQREHTVNQNGQLFPKKGGGVAQWLGRRISDERVPGSNPGRCTFRCGLEQVTFTLLSTG